MIELEIQYFTGCPNAGKMLEVVREVEQRNRETVRIREILVEDRDTARHVHFRGSPTLLIDGEDFDGLPAPEVPGMSCRLYPHGIPTVDAIEERIRAWKKRNS